MPATINLTILPISIKRVRYQLSPSLITPNHCNFVAISGWPVSKMIMPSPVTGLILIAVLTGGVPLPSCPNISSLFSIPIYNIQPRPNILSPIISQCDSSWPLMFQVLIYPSNGFALLALMENLKKISKSAKLV